MNELRMTRRFATMVGTALIGALVFACGGLEPAHPMDQLVRDLTVGTPLIATPGTWTVQDIRPTEGYIAGTWKFEGLDREVLIEVRDMPDFQTVTITEAGRVLFEQRADWSGALVELRSGEEIAPIGNAIETQHTMRWLQTCAEEDSWRCFIEELDALSHLEFEDNGDIFPVLP